MAAKKINYGIKSKAVVPLSSVKKKEAKPSEEQSAFTGIEKGLPPPPEHLTEVAKAQWVSVGTQLEKAGMITKLDYTSFVMYCETYALYVQANDDCSQRDTYITTGNGILMTAPWVTERRKYFADLMKMGEKLGLTPYARKSIKVTAQEDPELDI